MKEISMFMLERYRLGELNPDDTAALNEALAADAGLRTRLEELDESDRELRLRYPMLGSREQGNVFGGPFKKKVRLAGLAAIVLAGLLLPVLYIVFVRDGGNIIPNGIHITAADRAKGNAQEDFELSLFLRGGGMMPLPNKTILEEGNTVQLAYTAPAQGDHYGMIFSIDGRSVVTMHYPYPGGHNPRMISGRQTLLNQAYVLDDAPDFEVFIMVVSDEPMDMETIMQKAQELAENNQVQEIIDTSISVFSDSIVETITVLKKQ